MDELMEGDEVDVMELVAKNRTEFDTFMLEKRIDDLRRLVQMVTRVD